MDSATLCRRIRGNDPTLTEVHMNAFTDHEIKSVLRALSVGDQLRIQGLLLNQSQITVKSFATLVSLLCKPKPDPEMRFALSHPLKMIHFYSLDDQSLEAITCRLFRGIEVDSPRGINQIEEIKLKTGTMNERTGVAIRAALQVNEMSMLWKLSFHNLRMADSTFRTICSGLSTNTSLLALEIAECDVGDKGAEHIVRMLQRNSRLHTLNLLSNKIGDAGAVALANALEHHNKTLDTLCLEENNIGDDGFVALAKALSVNTTLDFLWVSRNRLSIKGEVAFADSIANMKGLRILKFGPVQSTATLARVAAAMECNKRMQDIRCIDDRDEAIASTGLHRRRHNTDDNPIGKSGETKNEHGEKQTERVHNLTKYGPMISFWCYLNKSSAHILFSEPERFPMWMWPYLIQRFQKAQVDGSERDRHQSLILQQFGGLKALKLSLIFHVLRQKPELMSAGSRYVRD